MEQLLTTASQFPTIIYSTLLGVVVVYWIVGLFGLVDLGFTPDADIDVDVDVDTDVSVGGLTGVMLTFGLTSVPFTLIISIVTLVCWLLSFYSQYYLLTWLNEGWLYYIVGAVVSVLVFIVSLPISAILLRPFKGIFNSAEAMTSQHLVGKEAVIATTKVSDSFGQARVFNDGAEILLDVRSTDQHPFKKGDKVLVLEYLPEQHAYIVAAYS